MPSIGDSGTGGGVYSIRQLAAIWEAAGGAPAHRVAAVSVALAESGGDPTAISPSDDYGLWQINEIHFGDGIINRSNWSDPHTNAREAVSLSGAGANWAAWCTAWRDPAGNCGHGYVPIPQSGSPAAAHMATVAAVLGTAGPAPAPAVPAPNTSQVHAAWNYVGYVIGPWLTGAELRTVAMNAYAIGLRG